MNCSDFQKELEIMARNKTVHFDFSMRAHVNDCQTCWIKLVTMRWEIAKSSTHLLELKEFLGPNFVYGCDSSWNLANEWNSQKRNTNKDILDFYKSTKWYVYNLTLWAACGQRPNYVGMATQILRKYDIVSIFDYGSGVGTDALEFASSRFHVETYEINALCNNFLKWRTKRRNVEIVRHSNLSTITEDFDLLWCMDVVEHLLDPISSLSPLLEKCRLFIYDSEFSGNSGGRHPFHFEHDPKILNQAWLKMGFTPLKDPQITKKFMVYVRD